MLKCESRFRTLQLTNICEFKRSISKTDLDEGVRKRCKDIDVRQEDVEGDGVAGKAPEVGRKEVQDGGHHLAQHVHVQADARKPADDDHKRVAESSVSGSRTQPSKP